MHIDELGNIHLRNFVLLQYLTKYGDLRGDWSITGIYRHVYGDGNSDWGYITDQFEAFEYYGSGEDCPVPYDAIECADVIAFDQIDFD